MIRYNYIVFCLVSILFIFGTETVYAQSDSTTKDSTNVLIIDSNRDNYQVLAAFSANYGSTNLSNEFMQKLLFGGEITERLKELAIDKTNNRNRFGLEVNYEGQFVDMTDTLIKKLPNYHYYIGFGSYNNISASYTRDLFSTIFYGNNQFEDQTAELGRSNFTSYKFEKLTIGLMKKDWSQSFGLSLIIGDRFNSFNFRQADLYTAPEGTELNMQYNGKIRLSDNNSRNFMSFNGAGIGLDYSRLLLNKKYTFSVTNFGLIFWARNTRFSNTEINYDFDGIEIDNVFQTDNDEIVTKAEAILPELFDRNFVSMLPTIIRFNKNFDNSIQFQSIYGVRYKFFSNYLPSVYGGGSFQINKSLRIQGSLAWGGYAGLRAGVGAYYSYKKFKAGIESQNITGSFLKSGNGNSIGGYAFYTF